MFSVQKIESSVKLFCSIRQNNYDSVKRKLQEVLRTQNPHGVEMRLLSGSKSPLICLLSHFSRFCSIKSPHTHNLSTHCFMPPPSLDRQNDYIKPLVPLPYQLRFNTESSRSTKIIHQLDGVVHRLPGK